MKHYDVIIVGSGPAGLGAAFHITEHSNKSVLILDKANVSTGGLRNDCKQLYTYPVCFPTHLWSQFDAEYYLKQVAKHLEPDIKDPKNLEVYASRAERLGVKLAKNREAHVGTDKAIDLINKLVHRLKERGVEFRLNTKVMDVSSHKKVVVTDGEDKIIEYGDVIVAPGRAGFKWLQHVMDRMHVPYTDNTVDVGIRVELKEENYPIVRDYYDPKFYFPEEVRTFCTNSGSAHVVREQYDGYYSVNGHSFSSEREPNGLVNFAMLRTITLTDPVVSGQHFGEILGQMAMQLGGGQPIMQRLGDFRLAKRSKRKTFDDKDRNYDFKATLDSCTPGDVSLAMPAKFMRDIWKAMKMLDIIIPGVLHPSTIIYYPEIKTYGNRPEFENTFFKVKDHVYMVGDGAGTSRGITAAWASGIRAADGIVRKHGVDE